MKSRHQAVNVAKLEELPGVGSDPKPETLKSKSTLNSESIKCRQNRKPKVLGVVVQAPKHLQA